MKRIIYILALGLLLSSCSDSWLDVKPTKSIPESQAFSTEKSFRATIVGLYYSLQSYGGFGNYLIETAELKGDDMLLKERNNWSRFKSIYTYTDIPTSSYGNTIYLNMYEVIEGCNAILDADAAGNVSLTDEIKNPLLGEVKTIRALAYFQLVRLFCLPYNKDKGQSPGVPLKVTSDVSIIKGRGKVKDVYDLILADLEFSVKNLKNTDIRDQVSLTFAQGLLARVYMTMGDNDNAIKYAKEAIKNAPALDPSFYENGISQKNSSVVFELQYTTNTYGGYMSYASFHDYGWQDAGGYGTIGASEDFYKNYSSSDLRKNWFINRWVYEDNLPYKSVPTWTDLENNLRGGNKNLYNVFVKNGLLPKELWDDNIGRVSDENIEMLRVKMFDNAWYNVISMYGKFPRLDAVKGKVEGTANLGYVPMMRTPELYLIVAECSALKGDNATAKEYLNKVQTNANAELYASGDIMEAIKLERRKELVGEGFRLFDIIRRGEVINRTNYWGPKESAKIDPTKENSKVYYPIPQKEIDSNPNISEAEQNAAYKK